MSQISLSIAQRCMLRNFLMSIGAKTDEKLTSVELSNIRAIRRGFQVRQAWEEFDKLAEESMEEMREWQDAMKVWGDEHKDDEKAPRRPRGITWDDLNTGNSAAVTEYSISDDMLKWAHGLMLHHDWSATEGPDSEDNPVPLNLAQKEAIMDLIDACAGKVT